MSQLPLGPTLTIPNGISLHVRVFTGTGNIDMRIDDVILIVKKGTGAATTVFLPPPPYIGNPWLMIKDGKLDAATNNITLSTTDGSNIATASAATTYVMNVNGQSVALIWDGVEWNVV